VGIREIIKSLGIEVLSERENGEALALCSFHPDTHPSFNINMNTGLWYCFGCGRGGNINRLIKNIEELGKCVPKSVTCETLIDVPKKSFRPICEDDINYPLAFNNRWLEDRGVTNVDVAFWGLRDTGLGILIPIRDCNGKLVGSAIRAKVIENRKYSYNLGFRRNHYLFGEDKINSNKTILVEGFFDVISIYRIRLNVLGILGTYISKEQIDKLRMLGISCATLVLDNDNAGRLSTIRNAERLLKYFTVYVPDYSKYTGKDPGGMKDEELKDLCNDTVPYLVSKLRRR